MRPNSLRTHPHNPRIKRKATIALIRELFRRTTATSSNNNTPFNTAHSKPPNFAFDFEHTQKGIYREILGRWGLKRGLRKFHSTRTRSNKRTHKRTRREDEEALLQ